MGYFMKKISMLLFSLLTLLINHVYAVPTQQSEVDSTPTEGNANHTNYFLLQISHALPLNVSVDYITQDSTAKAGEDYISTSGTATIKSGETSAVIGVEIIADTVAESDETFNLVLSNPQGASFPAGITEITKSRTIKDDDSTTTSSTAIQRASVVDCSTLGSSIGETAVGILAKYNYTKCAMVAGILVANSNETLVRGQDITAVTQLQADILAEQLDNNQDGVVDDSAIVNVLKSGPNSGVWMNIQSAANETNEQTIIEELKPYIGTDKGLKNSWLIGDYGSSTGYSATIYEKHVLFEEAIHMLHQYAYGKVYPSIWGTSDDGCLENSSEGCNWEQSTLTKLAFEAMTSTNNWYYHGENTSNTTGAHITGTCATPSCAAIEFIMNTVGIYKAIRSHDSDVASSGTTFPNTQSEMTTKLNSTDKGIAMKAELDNHLPNGMTWSYSPK